MGVGGDFYVRRPEPQVWAKHGSRSPCGLDPRSLKDGDSPPKFLVRLLHILYGSGTKATWTSRTMFCPNLWLRPPNIKVSNHHIHCKRPKTISFHFHDCSCTG